MNKEIIIVDKQDKVVGYGEKLEVHQKGLLHRAFSIFIFDWTTHKMLIQKRATGKYHSGGLWSNACCSHPTKDEDMKNCLADRLKEELGFDADFHIEDPAKYGLLLEGSDVIWDCGSFAYYAQFDSLCENEIDHVYLYSPVFHCFSKDGFTYNKEEVEELKWISIPELREWIKKSPQEFSAWFTQAFELAYEVLCIQARHLDMFTNRS